MVPSQNLPALVLKIMSGTFAPISDRYSPELRQLVLSLLSLEPAQRPPLSHIMAQPLCIRALLNLHTDVGSVRMRRPVQGDGSWAAGAGTQWEHRRSRANPPCMRSHIRLPGTLLVLKPLCILQGREVPDPRTTHDPWQHREQGHQCPMQR